MTDLVDSNSKNQVDFSNIEFISLVFRQKCL